jgi:hypothetical protein
MTTIDPRQEVGRRRLSKIAERADGDDGLFAELLTAEVFDVQHYNRNSWYDCRNQNTGTKYESRSTHRTVDNPDGEVTGRFRMWQDAHRRIAGAEGAEGQTAYYVFVLFEGDQPVAMRRMHPSTVTGVLRERSDDGTAWHQSGHDSKGRQHKLPWPEVLDL